MRVKIGIALITALLMASPSMAYLLNGTALDSCGNIPTGATVTLNVSGNTTTVAATGKWTFGDGADDDNLPNSTYLLTVANGVSWNDNTTTYTVAGDSLNNKLSLSKKYCSSYTAADVPSQVVDFIGGVLSSLAGASSPLVWAIVAGIVIGLVAALIVAVKKL